MVLSQVTDLQGQQASLQAEEEKLTVATQRLEAKVDAFRTRKETIKAAYTAAEAETHISEAVTGISEEMGDVGIAMQRAQDKTEQLQARAGALDELIASGALEDATLPAGRDDIQAQLDAATQGSDVEQELAAMKAQLPATAEPPALGAASSSAEPAAAAAPPEKENPLSSRYPRRTAGWTAPDRPRCPGTPSRPRPGLAAADRVDEHRHEAGPGDREKRHRRLAGHRPGLQRLAGVGSR